MASPPPETIILSTFAFLIETFTDFLVVSIHAILCSRALYLPNTFIATQKYNLKVQQNRHPEVCNWILNVCLAIQKQLLKCQVQRINFIIYKRDAEVIERWVFDVDNFPLIPEEEALTNFDVLGGASVYLVDVEEQLRATLWKLQYWGKALAPLPNNCTYTVIVELKDEAESPTEHPQQWVRSEAVFHTIENKNSITTSAGSRSVISTHVRSVEAGLFKFKAWIEKKAESYDGG